jgi:hypothetical protein
MSEGAPQFATAEYEDSKQGPPCRFCSKPTGGTFYRINQAEACDSCTRQVQAKFPEDSHAAYVRGILYGVGGAIVGLIIYVAFAIGTGLMIGYVALAVGFIVAKAMLFGSGGRRGRRYQIAAALLTYAAVSLAAVPIALQHHAHATRPFSLERPSQQAEPTGAPASKMSVARAIGTLAIVGLASPFLALSDPASGLIGLVILLVGLNIAWRLTAAPKITVLGPFTQAPLVSSLR